MIRKIFEFIKRAMLKFLRAIFSVDEPKEKNIYHYQHKEFLVTYSENEFFKMLNEAVGDKYYVFPQIHLPAIVDHKIPNGQSWRGALSKVEKKSVDYVLCEKEHLRPVVAIELDDRTHERTDRVERDKFVKRVLEEAKVPLVRFHDYKTLSVQDVANKIEEALRVI